MFARTLFSTCIAVVATLAIAGCGDPSGTASRSQKPAETVAASQRATQHYTSVNASGLVPGACCRARVDIHIVPGKGAIGSISYTPYSLAVTRIGQTIYLNSPSSPNFYELIAGPKAAKRLQGRWIRASVETAGLIHTLSALTELPNLTHSFFGRPGKLSMGGVTFVAGTKVIEVKNDVTGEVLYVAASGNPYPLQILQSGASNSEGIVFDQWNRPVSISAPADAIDIEKIDAGK